MSVDIQDVITCAIFCDDRLRGLGVARGRISSFPIDLRRRPYNTRTTVWYRSELTNNFSIILVLEYPGPGYNRSDGNRSVIRAAARLTDFSYGSYTTRLPLGRNNGLSRLNRWMRGCAKTGAARRMNQSGKPSKPKADGLTVSSIRKTWYSVKSCKFWEAVNLGSGIL